MTKVQGVSANYYILKPFDLRYYNRVQQLANNQVGM